MSRLRLDLTKEESRELEVLVNSCLSHFGSFDDLDFLKNLPLHAYKIPERLAKYLNEFKYNPTAEGYCIVATDVVDQNKLGHTPEHWELSTNHDTCQDAVMTMCLCAALLGDIYGWLTQQDGRMVHDILPIRHYELEQLGCGSREELCWHTEDAFHELRGDYLMLMCLRNIDRIPTTLSKPDYSQLDSIHIDELFRKQFVIRPDNSHKPGFASTGRQNEFEMATEPVLSEAYNSIMSVDAAPEKIAVLFGNKEDPCLRIDPYFMEMPETPTAKKALEALIEIVGNSLIEVALNPGEILIIDNYEVVHGRKPFQARYDGSDRWYKRINVIRDIRRCNKVLKDRLSRTIY